MSFQGGLAAELHVFAKSLKVQNKNKEEIRDVLHVNFRSFEQISSS